MGARKPTYQLLRGFVWSAAIERHECGRSIRHAHEVGAPAVGPDCQDLDRVALAADVLFEAVYRHETKRD